MSRGQVTLGNGEQAETMALVERLRRFRGNKTLAGMCLLLGYPSDAVTLQAVEDTCRRYRITWASPPHSEVDPTERARERRRIRQEAAERRQRQRRIDVAHTVRLAEIAKALAERPAAPCYKPGPLEW